MAEYYVDPAAGDNTNDGSTTALAWATRAHAAATIVAGDTVYCMATATDTEATAVAVSVVSYWVGTNASGINDGTRYVCQSGATPEYVFSYTSGRFWVQNFEFTGDSTPLLADTGAGAIYVDKCLSTGAGVHFIRPVVTSQGYSGFMQSTEIRNCTGVVVLSGANRGSIQTAIDCKFVNTGSYFAQGAGVGGSAGLRFIGCTFINSPQLGSHYVTPLIIDCLFINSQINIGDRAATNIPFTIVNTIMRDSSGYAILWHSSNPSPPILLDYCSFYNNTSGDLGQAPSGVTIGDNSITTDPQHTNPATGDFTFGPDSPLVGAGVNGTTIGPTAYTALTPAQIAAGVWTREGRTLTS